MPLAISRNKASPSCNLVLAVSGAGGQPKAESKHEIMPFVTVTYV